jgi:hypothetical protein
MTSQRRGESPCSARRSDAMPALDETSLLTRHLPWGGARRAAVKRGYSVVLMTSPATDVIGSARKMPPPRAAGSTTAGRTATPRAPLPGRRRRGGPAARARPRRVDGPAELPLILIRCGYLLASSTPFPRRRPACWPWLREWSNGGSSARLVRRRRRWTLVFTTCLGGILASPRRYKLDPDRLWSKSGGTV